MGARIRAGEALELSAGHYGMRAGLRRLQQANVRQPEAVAMLAEAVAAVLIDAKPKASATH